MSKYGVRKAKYDKTNKRGMCYNYPEHISRLFVYFTQKAKSGVYDSDGGIAATVVPGEKKKGETL